MNNSLIERVTRSNTIKYIFCDYYDTIIHRKVHPLKPFKIWAKSIKSDLNLKNSVNEIYNLRRSVMHHLCKSLNVAESEVGYELIMRELYHQLNVGPEISFEDFLKMAYESDYHAEAGVQYLNKKTIASLQQLKNKGYKIYCVSDFHADEAMLLRLMQFHGIAHIYDKIFVSASQSASKENKGLIFKKILSEEGISPNEVLMVGDNPISDVAYAKLHDIESHYLKRTKYKLRQKFHYGLLMFEDLFGT